MRFTVLQLTLAISGCGLIAPLDDIQRDNGGTQVLASGGAAGSPTDGRGAEAGSETEPDPDAGTKPEPPANGGSSGCEHQRPPAPKEMPDSDGPPVLYALRLRELDQGPGDLWRNVGLDLDGKCTDALNSERECTPRTPHGDLDGNHGIDNNIGRFVLGLFDHKETNLASDQERGTAIIILRVFGWNGTDDDPHVDVWFMNSVHPDVQENPMKPKWQGDDVWDVESTGFSGDLPLSRASNAYVVDGRLVAHPDQAKFRIDTIDRTLNVNLTDMWLMGNFSKDRAHLEDVVIAGRWKLIDVYDAISQAGKCEAAYLTEQLKVYVKGYADIYSVVNNTSRFVECDAISMGLRFRGYRSLFGKIVDTPVRTAECKAPSK